MFIYHFSFAFPSFDQNVVPSTVFVPSTLEDVQIRNKKKHFLFASRNPENQKGKQRRKET